jgi:hypothetical protein
MPEVLEYESGCPLLFLIRIKSFCPKVLGKLRQIAKTMMNDLIDLLFIICDLKNIVRLN